MLAAWLCLTRTRFGLGSGRLGNPALARASGLSTQPDLAGDLHGGGGPGRLAGGLMVPIFSMFADLGVRF